MINLIQQNQGTFDNKEHITEWTDIRPWLILSFLSENNYCHFKFLIPLNYLTTTKTFWDITNFDNIYILYF